MNFNKLKLKKLIATGFNISNNDNDKNTVYVTIVEGIKDEE
jgi:hypothetical protein